VTRTTNGSGPVSVQANTLDGTATAGLDYISVNTNLTWAAGDFTPKFVIVPIIDDNIGELDETFAIELVNANGEAQVDPNASSATVTIIDNDSSFSFDSGTYTVDETIGNASITVIRLGLTNTAASVEFFTQDGTATAANGDYSPDQ